MKNKPTIRYKKPLVCDECKMEFKYMKNLQDHKRKEHKKYDNKGWVIDFKK